MRVADDLLLLCMDRAQASEARKALEARLRPAAMPLKGTPQTAIRDLGAGQSAAWLGYHLAKGQLGVVARLPDDGPTWTRLRQHLASAHDEPDAPLAAIATIQGWIGSLGPCYRHASIRDTHARLSRIAREDAFEEIPTIAELEARWARACERWEGVRVRRGTGEREPE